MPCVKGNMRRPVDIACFLSSAFFPKTPECQTVWIYTKPNVLADLNLHSLSLTGGSRCVLEL